MKTRASQVTIGTTIGLAIIAAWGGYFQGMSNTASPATLTITGAQYECLKDLFEREVVANGD